MEIQETYNNLKKSRAVIADYVDLSEKIWQRQMYVQHYNRKKLFNLVAIGGTGLIILMITTGSGPKTNIVAAMTMAPIFFVFFRFIIGDVLDYFKRKKLAREIKPELLQKSEEMNVLVEKLDRFTILPEQYRTLHAVDAIGNYLINKRADSLKEAINLYEDELFKFKQLRNQQFQIQQNNHIMQQNKEMIKAQKITNSRLLWS